MNKSNIPKTLSLTSNASRFKRGLKLCGAGYTRNHIKGLRPPRLRIIHGNGWSKRGGRRGTGGAAGMLAAPIGVPLLLNLVNKIF